MNIPIIADAIISKKVLSPPMEAVIEDDIITSKNKYSKKYTKLTPPKITKYYI